MAGRRIAWTVVCVALSAMVLLALADMKNRAPRERSPARSSAERDTHEKRD